MGSLSEFISAYTGIAIFLSIIVSILSTYFVINNRRIMTRKKTTIEMLMKNMWDEDFIRQTQIFANISAKQDWLQEIYNEYNKQQKLREQTPQQEITPEQEASYEELIEEFDAILAVLNNYELISIGIREGIYDEQIFKRWYRSTVIDHWLKSRIFIQHVKGIGGEQHRSLAYCEFEALAQKWIGEGPLRTRTRHMRLWNGRTMNINSSQ